MRNDSGSFNVKMSVSHFIHARKLMYELSLAEKANFEHKKEKFDTF